jgi:hypothetical protein
MNFAQIPPHSLPGLTRQSMMRVREVISVRYYPLHGLMDARVKPGREAEY